MKCSFFGQQASKPQQQPKRSVWRANKLSSRPRRLTCALMLLVISPVATAQENDVPAAIPTPQLKAPKLSVDETLLNDLRPEKRPRLGLVVEDLTPQLAKHLRTDRGVYVASVEQDGPAETAGVKSGDVIVRVGETEVATIADLMAAVAKIDGETISLTLEGEKGRRTAEVKPVMVAEEPIELMDLDEFEDSAPGDRDPLITGDLIRQLMNEFGQSLDGRTLRDLGGLADQLLNDNLGQNQPLMDRQLKITIDRRGDDPAEIFVELDGEQYKTDAKHLDQLPQELRATIAELVGAPRTGKSFRFGGIHIDLDGQRRRSIDPPSLKQPKAPRGFEPLDEENAAPSQIDELRRELNELRRKLDRIQPNPGDFD
ncbi:serine endoprotease [Rosistilla ulvae]|uniref:Serine endoprotease n=1 Tax=Rosistilla ulvae TaxID=1930277 RepID=A0A517M853_9BACT|nr:PDZ domain-containing protein [Rosistilla ulvae]QDS90967.1 serine endoprotease [Rosistilla ulvae]